MSEKGAEAAGIVEFVDLDDREARYRIEATTGAGLEIVATGGVKSVELVAEEKSWARLRLFTSNTPGAAAILFGRGVGLAVEVEWPGFWAGIDDAVLQAVRYEDGCLEFVARPPERDGADL